MTKNALYILGIIFILLGILGFFNNPVLGIFQVGVLHNIVYLVSGVLALYFAGRPGAKTFAVVLGVIYAILTVLGFLLGGDILGLMQFNTADNFLHLVLAIVFLVLGLRGNSGTMQNSM